MGNEKVNRSTFPVMILATIMLIATTASMATTENVFAYNRNQAISAANDCGNGQVPTNIGCQNTDSQIQGDENSVALTSQQTFPSVPPPPTGFTVEGTGTGSTETFTCDPPIASGLTFNLEFSAEKEGTVTGTYTISLPGFSRGGTITDGTTDGITFTLSGVNESFCFGPDGNFVTDEIMISGECGDDVTIRYEDPLTDATFTGDVECILT
jgi:hypothetical protein